MEQKHSKPFIQFIQFIQWISYSDRFARLYLPVLRNAFRKVVGLITHKLVDQVPLTIRNVISAPSELHFGIIAFFKRLLSIIYIFGNNLLVCSNMIFIELLWENLYFKDGGPSGTWIHNLWLSVPTLLTSEISVRQWNWSVRDSLYSLYSGIHTVIQLLDYTYLFWGMLSEPLSGL